MPHPVYQNDGTANKRTASVGVVECNHIHNRVKHIHTASHGLKFSLLFRESLPFSEQI